MRCALERLNFVPAKKKFYFSAVLLWKISHRKLNFDQFCMLLKNKNSDISNEKSQKSKRKKSFSTTLKNKETNFWLV